MNKPNILNMIAFVKAEKLTPVFNQYDNLIAFNNHSQSTGLKYSKHMGVSMCVGATKEELEADIAALKQFEEEWKDWSPFEIFDMFRLSYSLLNDNLLPEDLEILKQRMERYMPVQTKVETITKTVSSSNPYPHFMEELESMDVDTLRPMMNEARRKGNKDIYNALRKVLRRKGVNC